MCIERGITGGISQCSKLNNVYLGKDDNPSFPSSFLMNHDLNNLYETAICEPVSNFQWVDDGSLEYY